MNYSSPVINNQTLYFLTLQPDNIIKRIQCRKSLSFIIKKLGYVYCKFKSENIQGFRLAFIN